MARSLETLVGRDRELSLVRRLLFEQSEHVVTLWGTAGIGKTRLARELGAASGGEPERFFCALADARRVDDVVKVIAQTLGFIATMPRGGKGGVDRLGRSLQRRGPVLLVLDNVEQIVESVAEVLTTFRALAPEAMFLVTSRELLGVPGEVPVELLPLRIGTAHEDDSAVRLLLDRARSVRPDFDADLDTLREIATRLDGIPLAIELAAARLSVLSGEQLLARLDQRFDVLKSEHAGIPARQRTLRSALDWSWELLAPTDRAALTQLSVCRGGFDLQAAEAITGAGSSALDALSTLRQKSLLGAEFPDGPRAEPRFVLLESIRAYARERLGNEAALAFERHATYYVRAAGLHLQNVDVHDGARALTWLVREQDNLVAVVERFLERDQREIDHAATARAIDACLALEPVLDARGPLSLGIELLSRTLQHGAPIDEELELRARQMRSRSLLAIANFADARADVEWIERRWERVSKPSRVRALLMRGFLSQVQSDFVAAEQRAREGLALAEELNAPREEADALNAVAVLEHLRGHGTTVIEKMERALLLFAEIGHVRGSVLLRARVGFFLNDLGDSAASRVQLELALAELRGWLSQATAGREPTAAKAPMEGILRGYLGNAMREEHRYEAALDEYREAIACLQARGDRRFEATFRMDSAITLALLERWEEASAALTLSREISGETGDSWLMALIAGYEVAVLARLGKPREAEAALARGRALPHTNHASSALFELHAAHLPLADAAGDDAREAAVANARAVLASGLWRDVRMAHARVSARILARAVDVMSPPSSALVITPGAARARPPNVEWIELEKHPALQRLVARLVAERLHRPGLPIPSSVLIDAGWPGERMATAAGTNRLRVALAGLRSRGFRNILLTRDGGYFLDPDLQTLELRV